MCECVYECVVVIHVCTVHEWHTEKGAADIYGTMDVPSKTADSRMF
jgi:hypothetical protein